MKPEQRELYISTARNLRELAEARLHLQQGIGRDPQRRAATEYARAVSALLRFVKSEGIGGVLEAMLLRMEPTSLQSFAEELVESTRVGDSAEGEFAASPLPPPPETPE